MAGVVAGGFLAEGFADPPLQAQAIFRLVLEAVAHPGRIRRIPAAAGRPQAAPGGLHPAAFALALTLIDFETPVWLDPGLACDRQVVEALRFHCGCPVAERPERAHFALIGDPTAAPPLAAFHPGTAEYPDRSTTVVLQVERLENGRGVRLSGPGIVGETRLAVDGVGRGFWRQWSANQRRFPLGVDLVLVAGDRLAALPRSVAAMA